MKERITHWQSTIFGVLILLFLMWAVWWYPQLLERPETLAILLAGLSGIFWKTNK